MKNIKRLIIGLFVILTAFDVQAKVKEDATYTDDMYMIGSTRFESDYIITASRAATAGADEAFIQQNVYGNPDFRGRDIRTYYYCALDKTWSEVLENGKGLKSLNDEQVASIKKALNIFYVNNEEKTLEIPFTKIVDEGSIVGPFSGTATYKNGKFVIPATWINSFSFTSEGVNVTVEMGLGEEEGTLKEYPEPVIKMDAKLSVELPSEVRNSDEFEFALNIKSNGNDGQKVTTLAVFSANDSQVGNIIEGLKYYDEETSTWKEISNMGEAFDNKIKDATIKYKATLVNFDSGKASFNISLVRDDGTAYTTNGSMQVYAKTSVVLVNGNDYSDIKLAFDQNKDGVFKLVSDVSISEALVINNGTITLDLNGKTLTFDKQKAKLRIRYNTNMIVKNGNIKGMDYTLQPEDDSTLTVLSDVNIILDDESITKNKYGIAFWDRATVNFSGNIVVTGDSIGISGSGNLDNTGSLNITGGTIKALDGVGIYLPNDGTTKITGGKVNAGTVLNIKAGSLEIMDGEFKASGEKVDPTSTTGSANATGDVIMIEENPNYKDHVKVNILGGTFESVNGYIIQEYNPTLNAETVLTSLVTGKYTTKHIIKRENGLEISYYDDKVSSLEVSENDVTSKYEADDLFKVLNSVKKGSTVKLLDNISFAKPYGVNNEVTLDLNGKTITFNEKDSFIAVYESGNLTVKNGNISGKNMAFQVQDNATLNVLDTTNIILDDETITKNKWGITMYDTATINYAGNMTVTGDSIGISGNGDDKDVHATLNITGGSINVLEGVGVYQPNYGKTNITGGKITADTVINIKAGSLDISGGEFKAVGPKVLPSSTTGHANGTGDVIFIEENANYSDNIKIHITDGTFESANGYIIQEYNPTLGTEKELDSVVTGKYAIKNTINENTFYYTEK